MHDKYGVHYGVVEEYLAPQTPESPPQTPVAASGIIPRRNER